MSGRSLQRALMSAAAERSLSASELVAITMSMGGPCEYREARELALGATKALVSKGLLVPGTVGNGGHIPWDLTGADAVREVERQWSTSAISNTWFAAATRSSSQIGELPGRSRDRTGETAADVPSPGARDDAGAWVQIAKDARLRAVARPDLGPPRWKGSRLRRRLLLKRAAATTVVALVTAWLGWAVVDGIKHNLASYTKTEGTVTARTDTSSRSASCQLDLDYSVNGQALHGVAKVDANCNALPESGSRAVVDVNTSDLHDIWIDGSSDASHADPAFFGFLLVFAPSAIAFGLLNWFTDYGGIQKLLASGTQWRQIEATVTQKKGSTSGLQLRLEAEDPSGNPCAFFINYRNVSPIGDVRKGDKVTLVLIANGKWEALIWRPDRGRVYVAHISKPR